MGSGKSVSSCWEIVYRALQQAPNNKGKRFSRWAAVRNTYPELKTTTLKTWLDWFGEAGEVRWDTPITFRMRVKNIGDGTGLDLEVIFLALDDENALGKLRSFELTGIWLNEASQLPKEVVDMATQRVGRYPSKSVHGVGPSWTGVIFDSNFPPDDHWIYDWAEISKPKGVRIFKQPGALLWDGKTLDRESFVPNPRAENVANLAEGYEYYFRQLSGKDERYVKVFVLAEYGTTLSGKSVYPEYSDSRHLGKENLAPIAGRPIILSFDYGLTPACVAGQLGPLGRLIVLREWTCDAGATMGIRQFYGEVVRPEIFNEWKGFRFEATGDPAGRARAQTDEKSCMDELGALGLAVTPAITNDFLPRKDSVSYFLRGMAGEYPAFLLDPRCSVIRRGFNGGYHYARLMVNSVVPRHKDRPEKNHFSHPHDALQYLGMYVRDETSGARRARPIEQASYAAWT